MNSLADCSRQATELAHPLRQLCRITDGGRNREPLAISTADLQARQQKGRGEGNEEGEKLGRQVDESKREGKSGVKEKKNRWMRRGMEEGEDDAPSSSMMRSNAKYSTKNWVLCFMAWPYSVWRRAWPVLSAAHAHRYAWPPAEATGVPSSTQCGEFASLWQMLAGRFLLTSGAFIIDKQLRVEHKVLESRTLCSICL